MKKQLVIFTVLISNIVFTAVLSADVREDNKVQEVQTQIAEVNVCNAVSRQLIDKGLDKEIAKQKVLKYLKHNEYANSLMIKNIVTQFDELSYANVISYISNSLLFQKSVDLSSYSNLIALIQRTNMLSHDSFTLKKIEKISIENKNSLRTS